MKKKNVWVLISYFGFVCCYLVASVIFEGKLRNAADRYIDDACTCLSESANVLFEYYKNNVEYIELDKIENLRRSELSQISESDTREMYNSLKKSLGKNDLNIGTFVELVSGNFISSKNEYITRDVLFDEEQVEILNKLKNEIEETNLTCISTSFIFEDKKVCFLGKPLTNKFDEYIGYKAVICNLSYIEEFQSNYYLDFDTIDFRILNRDKQELYTTNKFYQIFNKRNAITKTVFLEEQENYLTVCIDDRVHFSYFYIYRIYSLLAWVFIVLYMCREIFSKTLTINRRFALISAFLLLFMVWAQGFIYDIVIHNVQVTSNYMQANLCCFKDRFWYEENNKKFLELQAEENLSISRGTVTGSIPDYIFNKYNSLFTKFLNNDKYGEYVFVIDKNGNKKTIRKGINVEFNINHNWFNYNQYSFNTFFCEKVELQNLDSKALALAFPIVDRSEVQCVICVLYNVEGYVENMYSMINDMSNEKLIVNDKGDATSLDTNQVKTIVPLDAKGTKPYLSHSGIGQYKLIKRLNYRYENQKSTYYVFDSFFADRRVIFLRKDNGTWDQLGILLFTLLIETLFGICTHIYNRSVRLHSKVEDGTQLAIQSKLQTFK